MFIWISFSLLEHGEVLRPLKPDRKDTNMVPYLQIQPLKYILLQLSCLPKFAQTLEQYLGRVCLYHASHFWGDQEYSGRGLKCSSIHSLLGAAFLALF